MPKKSKKSPLDVLFCIVAKGQSEHVLQLMTTIGAFNSIVFMGHGTANSQVADLFGFGIEEREIILSFIDSSLSKKFLKLVNKIMGFDEQKHSGLAFTIKLASMEKNALEYLSTTNLNMEEKE